ncbi:MAG: hypothetical protein ACREIF_01650 [Chthoniobacterales bacterium]
MKTAVTQPRARPGFQMRRRLARQPFEEKIRKVGQLIQLSAAVKTQRVREGHETRVDHTLPAVSRPTKC